MRRISSSRSDQWGTTTGSIFGSAFGLGDIWRFSRVMGENGGAAFMLVHLAVPLELSDQVSYIVLPLSGITVVLFAGWTWPT